MRKRRHTNAIFIWISCLLVLVPELQAQKKSITPEEYLKEVQGYASIYRGEIEKAYSQTSYKNMPYYKTEMFVEADLFYNNREYRNVRMRYDTYKDQMLVETPENRSMILNAEKVQKVSMYDRLILNLKSLGESKLKAGFYFILYEGEQLSILSKETCSRRRVLSSNMEHYLFEPKTNYYVRYEGQYYPVKNKSTFIRLFPQYKKSLNKFAKDNHLNFREFREENMIVMGNYCNELIKNQ